ncbi:hypothetical protein ABZ883_26465 [Streptomyces sp. NPDC046977]|uniref:hypothetical protein n=1 Tax=Streptomyces sp. NPDC046977 TaxID=3154703 RepID=UPI0033EA9393
MSRMVFDLIGRDRLSRVLRSIGDGAEDMSRRIDHSAETSSRAIEGLHQDSNGRFRDIRGRFVSASAAAESMAASVDSSSTRSSRALRAFAPVLRLVGRGAHAMADDIDSSSRRSRSAFSRLGGAASSVGSALMSVVPSAGAMSGALQGVGIAAAITALPALGALVPMLFGLGLAAGAVKLGLSGVGDALALAGTDAKAYQKALDKMSPAQREFTKALVSAKKEFGGIKKEVQSAMLPGWTKAVEKADPVIKIFRRGVKEMAGTLGDLGKDFGKLFGSDKFQKDLSRNFSLGNRFVKEMTSGLRPFISSLLDFGAASKPTLDAFGNGISGLLGKGLPGLFEGLKTGISGSADMFNGLFNALNRVLPALGSFAGAVANAVGPALREIFETSGDTTAGALDGLAKVITKLKPVFSEIGAAVRIFGLALQTTGTIAADTAGVIVNSLWPSFGQAENAIGPLQKLSTWLQDNKQATLEFSRQVSNALLDFFGLALDNTPKLIGAFRIMSEGVLDSFDLIVSGADAAFGSLPFIGDKFKAANRKFDEFKVGFLATLDSAEAGTRQWAATVRPRLEQNRLQMNIDNWQAQIEAAKAKIKTVPAGKRAALQANITDLERKVAAAKAQLNSLDGRKAVVGVYTTEYYSRVQTGGANSSFGPLASGYKRAGGGPIYGPGTGTSDSIPAMLSNGEYVINAKQTAKHRALIEAINSGRAFARGGLVRGLTKSEAGVIRADTAGSSTIKLTGSASAITSMTNKLITDIQKAFKGTATFIDDRLVAMLKTGNTRLKALASQRDKIGQQIAAAKEFASGVTSNAKSGAALSGMDAETLKAGGGSILAGLNGKLANIRRFQGYISTLAKRGLSKTLLRQILEMGPEAGLPYASTLVGSSASMLKSINNAQASIDGSAKSLGNTGADILYDSGKNAGKGFLAGLAAQQKDIQKLMLSIATGMQKSIRKALGIKSPSTVFRQLGRYTTQGLALGLTDRAPLVRGAMAQVAGAVGSASIPVPQLAPAGGRGAGGGITYQITIQGPIDSVGAARELEKLLLKQQRRRGEG